MTISFLIFFFFSFFRVQKTAIFPSNIFPTFVNYCFLFDGKSFSALKTSCLSAQMTLGCRFSILFLGVLLLPHLNFIEDEFFVQIVGQSVSCFVSPDSIFWTQIYTAVTPHTLSFHKCWELIIC